MVILGMGSNWGDRLSFLRRAIQELKSARDQIQIASISPLYESPALLQPGAPSHWNLPYLNLAVRCTTPLPPHELLHFLKQLEAKIGRENRGRWAPREIDIDILAWDSLELASQELTIPHPGLYERPFAYLPFSDLAPDWEFPRSRSSAEKRISRLPVLSSTERSKTALTEVMGIINVTPDSFSDGGRHQAPMTYSEPPETGRGMEFES